MRAKTRTLLALLAMVAAAVASGCGGGSTVRERTARFTVTLDDYLIRPQRISAPGGRLTLTVVNRGRLGHTLQIRANETVVLAFMALRPGESRTRSFHLRRGSYTMFDAIGNYEELGMRGTLMVR